MIVMIFKKKSKLIFISMVFLIFLAALFLFSNEDNLTGFAVGDNITNVPPTNCFFVKSWGSRGNGDGQFNASFGIDVDSNHNVYVSDSNNNRVQVFDSEGNFLRKWGSLGSSNGQFRSPKGLAIDSSNNVYVIDSHTVQKFDFNSRFLGRYNNIYNSLDVVLGSSNDFYVSTFSPEDVRIVNYKISDGSIINDDFAVLTLRFRYIRGLAFDNINNRLFAATYYNILRFDQFANNRDIIIGSEGLGNGQLNSVMGLDIDYNNNYLYVADYNNYRVQIFTLDGRYVSQFGNTGPANTRTINPRDVAYDFDNGNHFVYISDLDKVFKFNCSFSYPPPVLDTRTSRPELPLINTTVQPGQVLCSDSDGNNPRVFGRVTSRTENSVEQYNDKCIRNSNFLWEYTCSNNGLWKENCYKCASCYNGRCLNSFKRHGIAQCESEERWQNR